MTITAPPVLFSFAIPMKYLLYEWFGKLQYNFWFFSLKFSNKNFNCMLLTFYDIFCDEFLKESLNFELDESFYVANVSRNYFMEWISWAAISYSELSVCMMNDSPPQLSSNDYLHHKEKTERFFIWFLIFLGLRTMLQCSMVICMLFCYLLN